MNSVIIPDETDATPDALLTEFARRGNRVAILEEVYRRANGHPAGYTIAEDAGIDTEDIKAVADVVWESYSTPDDGVSMSDRGLFLSLSYGHVADHVLSCVEDNTGDET